MKRRHLVIDTGNWLPGRKVVPQEAPEYRPDAEFSREYRFPHGCL